MSLADKLHSTITPEVICEKAKKQAWLNLSPSDIVLEKPLTRPGIHVVPVRVGDALVDLKVTVQKR